MPSLIRSKAAIATVYDNVIAIIDHDQAKSVTNEADNVIHNLAREVSISPSTRDIQRHTRDLG
jgi:hypothetical protein